MANRRNLLTPEGEEVYVENECRDSFTLLDILYANQFEGESNDPCFDWSAEEIFYRGAPPSWLTFYISEQAVSNGTATPFIKRDGYETLKDQICLRRKGPVTSTITLFHQQGCGGTTLAMQVMWDLRKTFRCAVLTGSPTKNTQVANEVVQLFTAGSEKKQNTVLLLVNTDEHILDNLQDSIITEINNEEINAVMPVVILLNCVRSSDKKEGSYKLKEKVKMEMRKYIILKKTLSGREQADFDMKKEELGRRFDDRCKQFHGFNILQSNFSQPYIRNACATLEHIITENEQGKQLVAFLSLLNAYVPESYLLESQCLDFLGHEDYDDLSLEYQMQPFSHLIITFQQDERCKKKVRMAHTMIAQSCTELLAKAGVTRSDTTTNFLTSFGRESWSLHYLKVMLTKREEVDKVNSTDMDKEKFPRLILDIQMTEGKKQCATVLGEASKTFSQHSFFPQALSRFYYKALKDYTQAETWAVEALKRNPQNSFFADTLGQVHKDHLFNQKHSAKLTNVLQMAQKAIKAFEDEEKLAEDEDGPDTKAFNSSGLFGYLQVCNALYDKLVSRNETWKKVLTKKVSASSFLKSLVDKKLLEFNELLENLRDEVERKCIFFFKYLTYSKPNMRKDDNKTLSKYTLEYYQKYVGGTTTEELIQMFKEGNLDDHSMEVVSFLVKQYTQSGLEDISTKCGEMCPSEDSETALDNLTLFTRKMSLKDTDRALINNILRPFKHKKSLEDIDPPELHIFALLWYWLDNDGQCAYELLQKMHKSYENTYKKYFRARYHLPLFFIGKGESLRKIVDRNVIENDSTDWRNNWKKEEIFRNPAVQELLLRLDGEVRNYKVYTRVGVNEIEVDANAKNSLWKETASVTFYLGFTIRGPVAFDIQKKDTGKKA